ncbi:MAG TPA: DUF418 domain-containing protein [Bryobacteraceae bacterium]|nr:DUF418 domain-containing protein [Bryobacteraceae bacterium]
MSTDAQPIGPVSAAERIFYIDLLRGMALFGILAANMRGFNAPPSVYGNIKVLFHGRADLIAQGFIDIFIQGKFITLFSFLFGMGFAIQLTRAQARGAKFLSFYPRRLAALALFGIVHIFLIWWGDILITYALAGALLLLFRNQSQKTLLYWAGGIFVTPIVVVTGFYTAYVLGWHPAFMKPRGAPDIAKINEVIRIYAHGPALQMLRENVILGFKELPTEGFALYALFLFLLGMWVWRSGIVERLGEYQPVFRRVLAWCLPIGLVLNAFAVIVQSRSVPGSGPTFPGYLANVVLFPSEHITSAGYAAGLALLIQNQSWRRRLSPFAAVGRMALTNYLTESVVCTLVFENYITGAYGRVGPAVGLIPTVILYGAQAVFSNWWLARYRFGPMEWLWRGMTYRKLPAMRKEAPVIMLPLATGTQAGE